MATEEHGGPYGFPLVSDRVRGVAGTELLVGEEMRVRIESLFVPTDDRFGHGEHPIGSVTITHGGQGRGPFSASFRTDDGGEAVVTGRMPGEDGANQWVGRDMVHVVEGTEGFAPWAGEDIPLESENPKRWG